MTTADIVSILKPVTDGSGEALVPVGAHLTEAGVVYRVWAPDHERVGVSIGGGNEPIRQFALDPVDDGFFAGCDPDGREGDLYWFTVANARIPDPASRFQPVGVEGPSQVVDPRRYGWVMPGWRPPPLRGRVIYEIHVGSFTPAGTFRAAIDRLDALAELGINTIELMPLADFAGDRNWGYDGVMLFAPARCYGPPDDLRTLVDAAHTRGLAVVIDVVYNHLGPVGNVLPRLARSYLHESRKNPWGWSLNFDGPNAEPVREFFIENACMWLDEYRVDGLRLDALHAIEDSSPTHLAAEISAAANLRGAFVIGEDERNEAEVITPRAEGGWGLDAVWADDFHHTIRVALTHQREAHFGSYEGIPAEWFKTFDEGWLFRGQLFRQWQRQRGTPAGHLPPECFVWCISNHDQVGNRPLGDRLHDVVTPACYRAVSMLLCLAPYTPMLFMGQEWAASSPFPYFTDHPGEIGENIRRGRLAEYAATHADYSAEVLARMPDPQAEETFQAAKLRWSERNAPAHAAVLSLYRECLHLRAQHAVFQSAPRETWRVDLLDDDILALRWGGPDRDWLLLFSLGGASRRIVELAEVRPRTGRHWGVVLSSNDERFGGSEFRWENKNDGAVEISSPGAVLWREM